MPTFLLVLATCLVAASAAAQDPGPAAPAPAGAAEPDVLAPAAMVASVNGQGITAQDVLVEARALFGLRDPSDEQRRAALVNLAQEILLSAEAERLGLELTELEVDEWLELIFGELPDIASFAEITGTSVAAQRKRFRRIVLSRLYLEHRIGRGMRYARYVPADPRLSRLVEITPRELKAEFERRKEQLAIPPELRWRVLAFDDPEEANEAVVALSLGRSDVRGPLTDREDQIPEEDVPAAFRSVSIEVGEWLVNADVGQVSTPFLIEGASVVFQLLERTEGREADFAEDQNVLRRQMMVERVRQARELLIRDEARKAVVWPAELFSS